MKYVFIIIMAILLVLWVVAIRYKGKAQIPVLKVPSWIKSIYIPVHINSKGNKIYYWPWLIPIWLSLGIIAMATL